MRLLRLNSLLGRRCCDQSSIEKFEEMEVRRVKKSITPCQIVVLIKILELEASFLKPRFVLGFSYKRSESLNKLLKC